MVSVWPMLWASLRACVGRRGGFLALQAVLVLCVGLSLAACGGDDDDDDGSAPIDTGSGSPATTAGTGGGDGQTTGGSVEDGGPGAGDDDDNNDGGSVTDGGDGATTGGALELGTPCEADSDCAGGRCLSGEAFPGGYCTAACTASVDCGEGAACINVSLSNPVNAEDLCLVRCKGDSDCRNGYVCGADKTCFPAAAGCDECAEEGALACRADGVPVVCESVEGCFKLKPRKACPAGSACQNGLCKTTDGPTPQEKLCATCTDDASCGVPGMKCLTIGAEARCTFDCKNDTACGGTDYTCAQYVTPGSSILGDYCQPKSGQCGVAPKKAFNEACVASADCASNVCVTTASGSRCSADCTRNADCPQNAVCQWANVGLNAQDVPTGYAGVCLPTNPGGRPDGALCTSSDECLSDTCYATGVGPCTPWSDCRAACTAGDTACLGACDGRYYDATCSACATAADTCLANNGCYVNNEIDVPCLRANCLDVYGACFVWKRQECTTACVGDADCVGDLRCEPQPVTLQSGPSTINFCATNETAGCKPSNGGVEICDGLDNDCAGGVDDGGVCDGGGKVETVALGDITFDGGGTCARYLTVNVPENAVSVYLVLGDFGTRQVGVCSVLDPDGQELADLTTFYSGDGYLTLGVPNTPRTPLKAGAYQFSAGTYGNGTVRVSAKALVRTGPTPAAGTLDLNVYFVGVPGLTAAAAPTDTDFKNLLDKIRTIYRSASMTIGTVQYYDVTGADATKFSVIDSIDGYDSEFRQLVSRSNIAANPKALNLFFVRQINAGGAAGVSAGIPGVPAISGTRNSGVIVAMETGFGEWQSSIGFTAFAASHECGHFMGLFHTTELSGVTYEPLDDTPVCDSSRDKDSDGQLFPSECGGFGADNLMFWAGDGTQSGRLSADQGYVLRRNPMVR
jgi:hypothetical protein